MKRPNFIILEKKLRFLAEFIIFMCIILSLLSRTGFSFSCAIRSNCLANETCLFSVYSNENAHVASCNYFNYKVCCDEITKAAIKDRCDVNEAWILSFYQENDSHVELAGLGNYNKKLCIASETQVICEHRGNCLSNETQVITLYSETNSHVGNSYDNKLCCRILRPDLVVNSSSLIIPQTPTYGDAVELNITVWNIGDWNATNVNVSCYANGTYFYSDIVNVSAESYAIAKCLWIADCNNNITIKVDPLNLIREHNENNNEASFSIEIYDPITLSINSPKEGENYYRNQTILLNASVSRFCRNVTNYHLAWYNSTKNQIAVGNVAYWQIPKKYKLGEEIIYANATVEGEGNVGAYVWINILNNPPNISEIMFEPRAVLVNETITISCNVTDVEDDVEDLSVNISWINPRGQWNNATASRIGYTFYRDWMASDPIGIYLAKCVACDLDEGCSERSDTFIVYREVIISITLNKSEVWWNESILVSGTIERDDGSKVDTSQDPYSDVRIYIKNILSAITETNAEGYYNVTISAPLAVGKYIINVSVRDPLTEKKFSNTAEINVKPTYGEEEKEATEARNVGCYEKPMVIQNPDGSLKTVIAKVCVWR